MFKYLYHKDSGIEIIDSYKVFWDKETINKIYPAKHYIRLHDTTPFDDITWSRSKFSLYLEWFIHTLCYKLNIQKDRIKNVYFEFDKSCVKIV